MTWEIGAYEYQGSIPIPPDPIPIPPTPLPGIKIRVTGKEKTVKITKRKTNVSTTVLLTVNKDTIVVIE